MATGILTFAAAALPSQVLDLMVVLATAALVAILLQRMRLAVIPAYLIAGILVGPGALGLVSTGENLQNISQLAILLLMFGIGLHLNFSVLGQELFRLVTAGVVSCSLSIVLGWPIALIFGLTAPQALTVAMALCLSSTAVVLRLIADRGELRHTTGRLALAILVVQDMAVLVMLAALPAIARWAGTGSEQLLMIHQADEQSANWGRYFLDATVRIGGIALLIILGKMLLPKILAEAARERTGEVMMMVSVAVAIGAGVATQLLGFSMELGAFMAGFLLSATPFRHQLSGQIAPLRDLFLAVFFTTLGMQLNPETIANSWWIILIGGAVMTGMKAISIGLTCWGVGATAAMAAAVGLTLGQAGEFSLVLIYAADSQHHILSPLIAENVTAIIVISLILTPALVDLGRRSRVILRGVQTAPWIHSPLTSSVDEPSDESARRKHVIVGGYGPVGQGVVEILETLSVDYTIIELNPNTVRGETGKGRRVVFGDVSNAQVLQTAGLSHADALILTIPDEFAVFTASAIARRRRPDIFIAVRVSLASHKEMAEELGVDHITVEETEACNAMKQLIAERFEQK